MHSARDVVAHYRDNQSWAQELIGRWTNLDRELQARIADIQTQAATARGNLARAYLLTLDKPALDRVEKLTGFRGFTRRDPLKAMDHEAHVLRSTIAKIVADERWQRRRYLVGPEGEHTRALAEAESMLAPWQAECAKFEDLEHFQELLNVKYDTPDFEHTWWKGSYWKQWAAGDRICEALGMDDFGDDVLPAYEKVAEPRNKWQGEVTRIQALIDAVHNLVHKRDKAEARIPRLPELYLEACQEQLAEFFEKADLGLLEEWLEGAGGDRGVQQVLRRVAGLRQKVEILSELRTYGVLPQITQLEQRSAKFQRKATKYARSKYQGRRLGSEVLDKKFGLKLQKYRATPGKIRRQVDRIVAFEDYGSFDLQNDPELWFVHMARKRPSRFTPRLQAWYTRHPDAAPELEQEDAGEAVAAAADAFDPTDRGYLS